MTALTLLAAEFGRGSVQGCVPTLEHGNDKMERATAGAG